MSILNLAYYRAKLTNVSAAIVKILEGGQDLSISDKRIIYGRLGNLFDEQARLEKIIAGLDGTGSPYIKVHGIRKR